MWKNRGRQRPHFAKRPKPGQESVWDYPRPPDIRPDAREVLVWWGDRVIAKSARTVRICETASPPTFYIPADDVDRSLLVRTRDRSFCEWKGAATYWALADQPEGPVGWSYEDPPPDFEAIRGHFCFYPGRVDCKVAGETVEAQHGRFCGGWVTSEIVGPFKGEPGTGAW